MRLHVLRALALLGALALPLLWLASLSASPELQATNYFRLLGALFGAGGGWIVLTVRGRAPTWKTCLAGGVAGSLVVTLLSVFAPALGRFAASGWIMSGVVGGGMVAFVLFGLRGEVAPGPARGREDGSGGSKTGVGR